MKYTTTLLISLVIGAVFTAVVYVSPSEAPEFAKVGAAWALATLVTLGVQRD